MKYQDGASGSEGEEGERYYTVDYSGCYWLACSGSQRVRRQDNSTGEENAELRQRYLQLRRRLRLNNIKGPSARFIG
ncbi:Uncharacterised protein [Escherichia coli]|uniref:Uncharacterized protein n=1 Tax=Escherichia coli TaxID=562 RepID=A0A376MWC0_ECOLX|nr:Uncharacterised protein [Escherichia coli]